MAKIAKLIQETEATFLAILVIGLIGIVFLIVFGNLSGNLGFKDSSANVANETVSNQVGYGLNATTVITVRATNNASFNGISNVVLYNFTLNDGTLVPASNFTVDAAAGTINATLTTPVWNNVSIDYTFNTLAQAEQDTNKVIGNLTTGAVSFFSLAPTWFILLAVVLLIIIVFGLIGVVRARSGQSDFSS